MEHTACWRGKCMSPPCILLGRGGHQGGRPGQGAKRREGGEAGQDSCGKLMGKFILALTCFSHRIDSLTLYCTPASGPHGFHTLGRTLESSLRSLNNLLERLHASYFFYLLPRPGKFIPVGHYLPAAVLLGASISIAGFDCPAPLEGAIWMLPAFLLSGLAWVVQSPLVSLLAFGLPRPKADERKSLGALTHLLYGAYVPTLAMVNFPQAVLLAGISFAYLGPTRWVRLAMLGLHPSFLPGVQLRGEWETVGNLAWPGVFAIWVPLWVSSVMQM